MARKRSTVALSGATAFILLFGATYAALTEATHAGPVAKGAAVGAAGGATVAAIAGGKPLRGAAAGAAVGAIVGKVQKEKNK